VKGKGKEGKKEGRQDWRRTGGSVFPDEGRAKDKKDPSVFSNAKTKKKDWAMTTHLSRRYQKENVEERREGIS